MNKSIVKLYYAANLNPQKNFIIESISSYLDGITDCETVSLQYHRHSLDGAIKISFAQSYLDYFSESKKYNYCSIQNVDEGGNPIDTECVYYYIVNREWKSVNTIMYSLHMDVLNTFSEERGSFTFDKETLIIREHRNRFARVQGQQSAFFCTVDSVDEGITTAKYYQGSESSYNSLAQDDLLLDIPNSILDQDWYLVVRSASGEGASSPIRVSVIPERGGFRVANYIFDISSEWRYFTTAAGKKYIICVKLANGETQRWTVSSTQALAKFQTNVACIHSNTFYAGQVNAGVVTWTPYTITSYSVSFETSGTLLGYRYGGAGPSIRTSYSEINALTYAHFTMNVSDVIGIGRVDRTDTYLQKIIKLPYCPIDLIGPTDPLLYGGWSIPAGWKLLYFDPDPYTSGDFSCEITLDPKLMMYAQYEKRMNFLSSPFAELRRSITNYGENVERYQKDTKLLHSAFHVAKVSYDSFSKTFQLEKMHNLEKQYSIYNSLQQFTVIFKMTSAMTSNFAFFFPQYECPDLSEQDYNKVLVVNRNNEDIILSNAYFDWMRTDYNYDTKTRWLEGYSRLLSALSGTNSVISQKKSAISNYAGISSGITGVMISELENQNQWEKSITDLLKQGTSVSGSSDVDIASSITGNRLKLSLYNPNPRDIALLDDLFYYNGYLTNVRKVPTHNNRIWFDFLMCEFEFDDFRKIPDECRNELTTRFNEGVTYFHKHDNAWDIERIKENWEVNV